jgi:hypothetical protein
MPSDRAVFVRTAYEPLYCLSFWCRRRRSRRPWPP